MGLEDVCLSYWVLVTFQGIRVYDMLNFGGIYVDLTWFTWCVLSIHYALIPRASGFGCLLTPNLTGYDWSTREHYLDIQYLVRFGVLGILWWVQLPHLSRMDVHGWVLSAIGPSKSTSKKSPTVGPTVHGPRFNLSIYNSSSNSL